MEKRLPLRYAVYDTAIGDVTLISNERRLVGLLFGSKDPIGAVNDENTALYDGIIELNQYCYGQRRYFDLKLEPVNDSVLSKVYEAVLAIPYGETKTEAELAAALKLKAEDIDRALIENPLPIFIPTHRVIVNEEEVGPLSGCDTKMLDSGEDRELKKKLIAFEAENKDKVFISER